MNIFVKLCKKYTKEEKKKKLKYFTIKSFKCLTILFSLSYSSFFSLLSRTKHNKTSLYLNLYFSR